MSKPHHRAACFTSLAVFAAAAWFRRLLQQAGGEQLESETANTQSLSTEPLSTSTNSVAVVKTTNLASPATASSQAVDANLAPDEVCQRFLQLLQSGNRIGAENLLTRTALMTTSQAGLKLEPMGGPTSTYRIGEVRYATNQKKLAHVDTYVVDQVDGEPYEMEVTWQLHKHGEGWRISGVMLELEQGKTKDLLSLENKYDVAKLQTLAGVEVPDQTQTRQAKVPADSDSPAMK